MKKMLFKKVLNILDTIEIQGIETNNLYNSIITELKKDSSYQKDVDLYAVIDYIFHLHVLKETKRGLDLNPCATIFAKADSNSRVEAIALFECLYRHVEFREYFLLLLEHPIHKVDLYSYFDELSYSLLTQTALFFDEDHYVRLRREYMEDVQSIIAEYAEDESLLLSVTLCARYTSSIVSHEDANIDYKNQGNHIVPYKQLQTILHIIPRRGVPCDRDETKALQSFYKDTLFHECSHACPLCEINIPHMLIASHIKPFRDCAHIYEAIDHNNGLLLCRNHDYLFDQGFISFEEDGTIMMCEELRKKESLASYVLDSSYALPQALLTQERKLFLEYHRHVIYKDKQAK